MMRRISSFVVPLVAAACALPSADEFARAPVGSDAGDGGSPATTNDGGGLPPDGGSPDDGGAEGGVGFCPTTAAYCTDFSQGTPADVSPDIRVAPDGTLVVEGGVLRAKLPASNDGKPEAQLVKDLSTTALKVTIDVDINVALVTWDGFGNATMLVIQRNGDSRDAQEIYISGSYLNVTTTVDGSINVVNAPKNFPRSQWVHVKLDADFTPHAGSYALAWDGEVVMSQSGLDFAPAANATMQLALGLSRNNPPTPSLDVQYDNLVVTLH